MTQIELKVIMDIKTGKWTVYNPGGEYREANSGELEAAANNSIRDYGEKLIKLAGILNGRNK